MTTEIDNLGHLFTDSQFRSWRLEFNYGNCKTILDRTKLDFVNAYNGKALKAIALDDHLFMQVVELLCEQQIKDQGLSVEQWYAGFDGHTLAKAMEALEVAVLNFTPPARRPVMKAILERAEEVAKKQLLAVEQKVRSQKMDQLMERGMRKIDQQLDRELEKIETFGLSDLKLPPS